MSDKFWVRIIFKDGSIIDKLFVDESSVFEYIDQHHGKIKEWRTLPDETFGPGCRNNNVSEG